MSTRRSFDDYPATMTTDDVAELLGHPAPTIRRWCNAGMIPAHKNPGSRIWQFDRDELIGWLRSEGTAKPAAGRRAIDDGQPEHRTPAPAHETGMG